MTMNMFTIKKASREDCQVIHDMAEIVFRDTYKTILSPDQMEYMMDWMYSVPNLLKQFDEGHVYYIAESLDGPCGYVSIQPEGCDPDGIRVFHLQKIYVLPKAQKTGLGKRLFDKAVDHVKELSGGGPARIELNVNRGNPAVGFYRKQGMRILRQGDFPIGNGYYMNDYIMGLDIASRNGENPENN